MSAKNETMGGLPENLTSGSDDEFSCTGLAVFMGLALWLGLVSFLASRGAFVGRAGSPPLPIFFGVAIPLTLFFTAYFGWGAFRRLVLGADLRLIAAIQAWRWAGLGFLTLYSMGILPGLFAIPAGLGDMAIGVTAPWIVLRLARQPLFAASPRFRTWNILGLTDFVVAVSMATLSSGAFPGINGLIGNLTTSRMAQLPLVLIPTFMVPLFSMLHLTALFQARRLALAGSPSLPPRGIE